MWKRFNNNPVSENARVGDCAIRALSKALGISWEEAYAKACKNGYLMGDLPNSDNVWGSVLRKEGFKRKVIPNSCPDCFTISDFAHENPVGVYVLGTGSHAVTVIDGDWYDSWDSGCEVPIYYWTDL